MDEEINIIDSNARNEKIKNFFINNKKILISFFVLIFITIIVYFAFNSYKNKKKIEISDLYNSTIIEYSEINKQKTINSLINLINKKDPTYSPLSLYFIIDYELITEQKKINKLFDIIIDEVSLEKEIKNLIIYKKALYNADKIDENEILKILNPLINSKSVWKGHALYLITEFFYSKNEKQKSKEFFSQIVSIENTNSKIKVEAQKRLRADFSE